MALLQLAHAGELAAALAYAGHAASVADPAEQAAITCIKLEELDHRVVWGRCSTASERHPTSAASGGCAGSAG